MDLQVTIVWKIDTALNVAGAPTESALVDRPLLRQHRLNADANRLPVLVPASTLKGKLRAEAQRILCTFGRSGEICSGRSPESMCPAYWWTRPNPPADDHCLLCRLFGSPWREGKLAFSDAVLGGDPARDVDIRPGVGISRCRGTVKEKLLFLTETAAAVPEGLDFEGSTVVGRGVEPREAALIWLAIHAVAAFGSSRSRGQGWVGTREVMMVLGGQPLDGEQLVPILHDWLEAAPTPEGAAHA